MGTSCASYFVASARAPVTGTTGESIPIFAQRKYTTAPTMKASTGAAGTVGNAEVSNWQDADHEARRPGDPARRVEAGARAAPFLAVEQVVHQHRAADRTEGGADDHEDADGAGHARL